MIEFSVDPDTQVRVAKFTGTVDDDELLSTYRRLRSSPDYDASANVLVDLSDVERLDVSPQALGELVATLRPMERNLAGRRRAIVAASDAVYGMARMYEIMRSDSPEDIRVFRDLMAAREWLATGESARTRTKAG